LEQIELPAIRERRAAFSLPAEMIGPRARHTEAVQACGLLAAASNAAQTAQDPHDAAALEAGQPVCDGLTAQAGAVLQR
jgi:hypothetical protein